MQLNVLLVFIGLLLSSCSSSISEPVTSFQVQTPRPFGYVIGDEIKQRIIIEVRKGLALQYSSLPSKGAINRWLNLNKIKVDKTKTGKGIRYQVELTYQLFYAPLEVKMLELSSFSLQFRQFGHTIEKRFQVGILPLHLCENWRFEKMKVRNICAPIPQRHYWIIASHTIA